MNKTENEDFEVIVVNGRTHYLPSTDELKSLKKIIIFLHDLNYGDEKSLNKVECLYDILSNERKITGDLDDAEKENHDITIKFINECCVNVTDTKRALSTAQMWKVFCQWCKNNNEYVPQRKVFTKSIAEKYNIDEHRIIKSSNGKRYYPFTLSDKYVDEYIEGLFRDKGVIL